MARRTRLSRREFVAGAGGLLIGFSVIDAGAMPQLQVTGPGLAPVPPPSRLDAWLQIDPAGLIRMFTGKAEIGMGVETAFAQIVAEELEVSPDRVTIVMGDTARTPDQGGVGGSTSIAQGAKPLRNVAATTRHLLLDLASRRLGVPPAELQVRDGIISIVADPSRRVSYGELVDPDHLETGLKMSGQGFALNVEGAGIPKPPAEYRIVGTSVPRKDLPPKLFGTFQYVTDIRVPNMLHGRVVRPAGIGTPLVSVSDEGARSIAGYVKAIVKDNFVGVVAETEWAAIRAAKALKIVWGPPAVVLPAQADLYRHMRSVATKATRETVNQGNVTAALAAAATRLSANYESPFQSHATMGPGCSVADVRSDGMTTVWSGAQKPHALQKGLAELLGLPLDRVRVIWVEDSGSYGRPGFEDTAADAALMSQAIGRPVRVQWMRADMTSWGAKGPAVICEMTAGLDAQAEVVALDFHSRAFSGTEISPVPATAGNYLASQLTGRPNRQRGEEFALWGVQTMSYRFANLKAVADTLPAFHDVASPLRTTHLRDPGGPATSFAMESFVDELAAAARADPVQFRLKYLDDARARAVLTAAAEKSGWQPRPSPKSSRGTGGAATGRGIAVGVRNGTYVSTVAEVEVDRQTGLLRVMRLVCAHDCGLVINPGSLRGAISANLMQSLSRALKEEVRFDRGSVTSVDWATYPVARASDVPPHFDIVLLNNVDIAPSGAGEASSRPTAAAIANAIFDATGARVRQAPLTPARIKAALSGGL